MWYTLALNWSTLLWTLANLWLFSNRYHGWPMLLSSVLFQHKACDEWNNFDFSPHKTVNKPQIELRFPLCVSCQQGSLVVTMETELLVLRLSGAMVANFLGFKFRKNSPLCNCLTRLDKQREPKSIDQSCLSFPVSCACYFLLNFLPHASIGSFTSCLCDFFLPLFCVTCCPLVN